MSDIDVNYIADVLNNKVDLPNGVGQDQVDYVVEFQKPTSLNNYTWYRLYKSGWIEQGGVIDTSTDAGYTQYLTKNMADTNYIVLLTRNTGTSDYGTTSINARWQEVWNITTSSFMTWGSYGGKNIIYWEIKGLAAS